MIYKAFISYSHAADGRLAPALQSALHRFAKPWYRLRALRVFRDKTTLAATPALWPSIEKALGESEHFLLLASPEAAASPWVQREIMFWIERRPQDREKFLIILTGGTLVWDNDSNDFDWTATDAIPRLPGHPFAQEPLFLDLRWARKEEHLSPRHPDFRDAIATLAATLHDRPKDEISGEEVRQHRIARRLAWSGVTTLVVLLLLASGLGYFANLKRLDAERQQRIAVARQLAAQAALATAQQADLLPQSVLLGLEAVARFPSMETEQGLRERVALLPQLLFERRANGMIWALAISPDGKHVAAAGGDSALVWDIASGGEIARLRHDDIVHTIAFSPDGRRLATGSWDRTVRIWDLSGGAERARLQHDGQIDELVFSGDGKYLATSISVGPATANRVWLWDAAAGRPLGEVAHDDKRTVTAVRFAPDSRHLATASWDRTVRVWDVATRRELMRFAHADTVHAIAFNSRGTILASGGEDGRVRQWDVGTGREIANLPIVHQAPVRAVSFSPDDGFLGTGSDDHTARIWDARGREISRMGHGHAVHTVRFSPDGKEVATAGDSQTARLWDAATGQEKTRAVHEGTVNDVAFSPDGRLFASAGGHVQLKGETRTLIDPVLRLWNLHVERTINRTIHQGSVGHIAFSRDSRYLVTGSWDRTARVSDASTGSERFRIVHDDKIMAAAISSDSQWIATGSMDGEARLLHLATGRATTLPRSASGVRVLSFSPDVRHLAIGTVDGTSRVWDIEKGRDVFQRRHAALVSALSYSADGRYLMSSVDAVVSLSNAADGRDIRTLTHSAPVWQAEWSPDSQFVATLTSEGVRVWKAEDGAQLSLVSQDDGVKGFAWHPDSRHVATWDNYNVRLWEVPGGTAIREFGETATFRAEFTPDGQNLVVIGSGPAARVLELATGREIARLLHASDLYQLTISPDGRSIATVSEENVATIWVWRASEVMAQACRRLTRNLTFEEWTRYLGDEPYRKTCPDVPIHFSVVEAALTLAREGRATAFAAAIRRLQTLEPALPWSRVEGEGTRLAAVGKVERAARRGEQSIRAGRVDEGLTALREAQSAVTEAHRLGAGSDLSLEVLNRIGWLGTIWSGTPDFLYSCDQAVARDRSSLAARDTRGVARALKGDLTGAIEDFEAFVATVEPGEIKSRRLRWIDALKKGTNPINSAELEAVRRE